MVAVETAASTKIKAHAATHVSTNVAGKRPPESVVGANDLLRKAFFIEGILPTCQCGAPALC